MAGDTGQGLETGEQVRSVPLPPIINLVENWTGVPFPFPLPHSLRTIIREVRKADLLFMHDCLYMANIIAYCVAKLLGSPSHHRPTYTVYSHRARSDGPNNEGCHGACGTHPMLSCAEQVIFIGNTTMGSYAHLQFKTPLELIYNGVNTDLFHARDEFGDYFSAALEIYPA